MLKTLVNEKINEMLLAEGKIIIVMINIKHKRNYRLKKRIGLPGVR